MAYDKTKGGKSGKGTGGKSGKGGGKKCLRKGWGGGW